MASSSGIPPQPAQSNQLDASIELERAIQDGAVTERSRSDRRNDPDDLNHSEPSYAPTSVLGSNADDVNLLMIDDPPHAMVPIDRLGEPTATANSPMGGIEPAARMGGTPANFTLEQRNRYNAFDQRQVYLQQNAVLISQDQGPLVASEAREAINHLEVTAEARHKEVLRNAESSIAGHAQEAYDRKIREMGLFQEAEAQQAANLRSELQAAHQANENTQTEAVKRLSEFEVRMNEMTNLITELRATNERQRIEYETQLHRQRTLLAAQMPPIRVPSSPGPIQQPNVSAKPGDDRELIPAAPGLPTLEEQRGRSWERRADNVEPKAEPSGLGGDPPGPPKPPSGSSSSSSSDSSSSEAVSRDKIRKMIKKQLRKASKPEGNRPKEADRVIVPKFPNPEAYRNWRIRVRDAVTAASSKPDEAFKWVEEVWAETKVIENLADSGKFATLDAKLMSALTNVIDGDLSRQLDIFKENEAKKGIHAKGRQALWMIHKHFSTSQKHGAIYDLEDLMAVQMVNDDLKGFVSRWDAVIAGMREDPGTRWKEAYFHNAVKRFKPLEHDLAIYDRAPEGDAHRTYDFLIKSARDYLERKRLEKMRNANKRAISGKTRDAAAAPPRASTPGGGQVGICFDFQKGKCTRGDNCKYRHEKVKGGEKGKGKGGKSRSPSRTRSLSPGSRQEICKFFAAGTCRRGKDCAFKHVKPAAAAAPDESKKKKKKKNKKPKKEPRSRSSSRGSDSSKGSQSQRSPRGGKPASSSNSAAVCLLKAVVMVAALRPSTSLPCRSEGLALPSTTIGNEHRKQLNFSDDLEIYEHEIDRNSGFAPLRKLTVFEKKIKRFGANPPVDKIKNEAAIDDSILAAQMLQSAVHRELEGRDAKCRFLCNSDIGCKHCIRADLRARPGNMPRKPALPCEIAWIADTGSAQDLVCKNMVHPSAVYESQCPLDLTTANGSQIASQQAEVHVSCIDKDINPYVLPDTPAVVSVGMRCLLDGWDFVWRAFSRPYFKKRDGKRVKLEIKDYVPYLPSSTGAVPAAVGIPFDWNDASGNRKPMTKSEAASASAQGGEEYEPSDSDHEDHKPEVDPGDLIVGGEVAPGPPSAVTPGFDGEPSDLEDEEDGQGVDPVVDDRLVPKEKDERRDRGQQALKEEARSLSHLMTHTPKNPYCDVCNKAKMYKPTRRSKGGSTTVECSVFGEHITGDHLITRTDEEEAIDGERVALVIKDVATNFKWIYPSARRTARDCVLAMKHFTSHVDEVGVFYSDNADELRVACEELKWRHVTSFDYVSKTNAVAERNLRTTLEGTRANLEQAGLHHSYWPHAARHWCMSHNIDQDPERTSPWKLRFGEDFKGPHIPFGARIDYWTGPKNKPKKGLKFDPSSNPGVFLGYAIHPEFVWRKEYLVIPLKEAMEKDFADPVSAIRVFNLSLPDTGIQFPLKGKYNAIREGLYLGYGLPSKDSEVDLSVFDAKPIESVDVDQVRDEVGALFEAYGIGVPDRDGPEPSDPEGSQPGDASGEGIFDVEDVDEIEMIDVIDPKTGKTIKIPKDSASYYSASGVKARRYKGSSKPDSIPSDLWRDASKAERERAKKLDLLEKAAKEHEDARARSERLGKRVERLELKAKPESSGGTPTMDDDSDPPPAMPVISDSGSASDKFVHREKNSMLHEPSYYAIMNALVARPVGQKEINNTPAAKSALDKEWVNLETKGAWDYSTVQEWGKVSQDAIQSKKKVHVGKVFEICVEKGSELQENDPLRKFKGRTVFQGNNVKDESADVALFSELGSSPANMEAGKSLDAYGSMPGNTVTQGDGKQAYTQALMKGVPTWVRLPKDRWPKEWVGKYTDPVVQLVLALYGHLDSGGLWQRHCEQQLFAVGFVTVHPECWPSMFWHPELKLLLGVYVDDFKMAGPKDNMEKGWELISRNIDMDKPEDAGRYLGCDHVFHRDVKLSTDYHPFAHVFDDSLPDPSSMPAAAARRTQDHWEHYPEFGILVCDVNQPRKKFHDLPKSSGGWKINHHRYTEYTSCQPEGQADSIWHDVSNRHSTGLPFWWTGSTYFIDDSVREPAKAVAAVKNIRNKSKAKKAARAQGFTFMDELIPEKGKAMNKPVTVVEYDMTGFLQQCIDRYTELAGKDVKLKTVATPFYDDKIARPIADEQEARGELQPIAARVLMKVLFAARMARYDLLRATQGLASRVTKWSPDCDKALHRLMCYIHSTISHKMTCFIGDSPQECKLWCFADADHAGEHDNRSTSGCCLVLVGPNTYYPLTAFSKKQTSTAMSSTEAEVTAANLSIRAVGLPSSCLWNMLRNAGGDVNGQTEDDKKKEKRRVETRPKDPKEGFWTVEKTRVIRHHVTERYEFCDPSVEDCPVDVSKLSRQRYTIMIDSKTSEVDMDLTWDWTYPEVRKTKPWKGKTIFRFSGDQDVDYGIESREIRGSMTDLEYVGSERTGDEGIYLVGTGSYEVVFLEDNQATIRIIESGKSPSFRHTDKTQRLNLSWLAEQFRRKHFRLVYVTSQLQAADILTKPFANSEKWKRAVSLIAVWSHSPLRQATERKACPGELRANLSESHDRVLVEFCCGPESKLGDLSRKPTKGCHIIRCTEDRDVTKPANRQEIRRELLDVISVNPSMKILVWISIPCTGGTPWIYINLMNESSRRKVEYHQFVFQKIWSAMSEFVNSIRHLQPFIALEWPSGCVYWKYDRVIRFLNRYNLEAVKFDGCRLGVVNKEGTLMKKPWTVASNCGEINKYFDNLKCTGDHVHAEGRGEDLKNTENYTYEFTDRVHRSFAAATKSSKPIARSSAAVAIMANFNLSGSMESARMAGIFPTNVDGEVMEAMVMPDHRGDNERGWEQLASKIASCASVVQNVGEAATVVDLVAASNPMEAAIE